MRTAWFDCMVTTTVVVGSLLLLPAPVVPGAPPGLAEQEVRAYVEIQLQITKLLGDLAIELQRQRSMNVDVAHFNTRPQERIDALLGRHGHTRESWDALRRRVEAAAAR